MASVVDICNMALAHLRVGSINNLNESSVQAQQCKLFYEMARDQALSDANWGFNRKLEPLAQLDVDIFNWAYVWQYPTDCLHINNLVRNLEEVNAGTGYVAASHLYDHRFRRPQDLPRVEFRLLNNDGARVIATNEPELRVDYRAKVDDPNLYLPDFRMALSYLLASYIAVVLVGIKDGRQRGTDCLALYNAFKTKAMDLNANESYRDPPESDYITVRES